MNDFLSKFIEHVREVKLKKISGMGYKYGNFGKLRKNKEEKVRVLEAEEQNYEHMIANMTEEHAKYTNRVGQVTDYNYVLALRRAVNDSKDYITQLQK